MHIQSHQKYAVEHPTMSTGPSQGSGGTRSRVWLDPRELYTEDVPYRSPVGVRDGRGVNRGGVDEGVVGDSRRTDGPEVHLPRPRLRRTPLTRVYARTRSRRTGKGGGETTLSLLPSYQLG